MKATVSSATLVLQLFISPMSQVSYEILIFYINSLPLTSLNKQSIIFKIRCFTSVHYDKSNRFDMDEKKTIKHLLKKGVHYKISLPSAHPSIQKHLRTLAFLNGTQ